MAWFCEEPQIINTIMKLRAAGAREAVKRNCRVFQQRESETNVPKMQKKNLLSSRELCFLVYRKRDPKSIGENDPEHRLWGYSFRLGCVMLGRKFSFFNLRLLSGEQLGRKAPTLQVTDPT